MSKTFVIAELAGTHDGSERRLADLLHAAHTAGADAFKLQFWSDSAKVAARLNAPELVALYERVRTPLRWVEMASIYAHGRGKEFLCTVDLFEDIPTIAPYVDRWKIASVENHDHEFMIAHSMADPSKPIIVSFGMDDGEAAHDFIAAVNQISGEMTEFQGQYSLLHCISGYPTPLDEANLAVLRKSVNGIKTYDGLSDHTANVLTGAFAVCAGAKILEVHVKADDTPSDNPDAPHSLTPAQFRKYVANVRLAERMLGDGVKRIMESERPTLRHRVKV